MASILDKYGIKEVCDVMFYEIDSSTGDPTTPVLYIDTAKVFTSETTAENTSARGGKGNPELIAWDFNKEINVTLEDALFSMKSMAIMFGAQTGTASSGDVIKTIAFTASASGTAGVPSTWEGVGGAIHSITSPSSIYDEVGATVLPTAIVKGTKYFIKFNAAVSAGTKIEISSTSFPDTYYVVGDTYARSEVSGDDEYFQLIFPKAKVLGENTITTQAEGDPSTFSMNLKILRGVDGNMMKLIKYTVTTVTTTA